MKNHKKRSKNIILFGLTSLFADASSETIRPLLPLFISSLGGAGLIIGLIGGLTEGISALLKLFSGYLSDKIGRRKLLTFTGYTISAIFKVFLPFTIVWQQVLTILSLERVGKGIRDSPRDSLLSQSIVKKKLGKAFGIHRALDTTGAIAGAVIALFLFWYFGLTIKSILLIAAVIGFFALIPLIFVKDLPKPKKEKLKITFKDHLSKKLKKFIIIATIFALGNFTYMFLILRVKETYSMELAIIMPLALYIVYNVVYAVFSEPLGVLSDKIGRKKIIATGYLLFAATCLGFIFFSKFYQFLILFILYGLVFAFTEGNQRAYVSDLSNKKIRGTALGTFYLTTGLAAIPAGIIAGLLWEYLSPLSTFGYGAALGIVSTLLLTFIIK